MYPKSIRTTTFHIHRGGRGEDGVHYIGGGGGGAWRPWIIYITAESAFHVRRTVCERGHFPSVQISLNPSPVNLRELRLTPVLKKLLGHVNVSVLSGTVHLKV